VIVVKAKEPYLKWALELPDPPESLTLGQLHRDCHAYLIPMWDTYDQLEDLLVEAYDIIFKRELFGWHRDGGAARMESVNCATVIIG